jgi:ATP-binding cassette, subfamily F, member 3
MALVTASAVSMHFGGPLLLDGVTLKVEPGARIGLIGRNGTGKSTLLGLLAGRLEPSAGAVQRAADARVAFQAQELAVEPGETPWETMRAVFADDLAREASLRDLERRLGAAPPGEPREKMLREYDRLQHAQHARGVYDVDRRIADLLTRLGLPEPSWRAPLSSFSGGERNVIGLARVLVAEPDLMLLDEPSNHLDMEGVEWFVDVLRRTPAAVVVVSHNRHLLDAVATEIWELSGGRVTTWKGNYTEHRRLKAEAIALQERRWKVQERLRARIEFQARRLRDMANAYDDPGQARRARSMLRRLERMETVERPQGEAPRFRASLAGGDRHGRIAIHVRDFSFAHGDRVLFDHANLEIEQGERVCLVGPNGSGKTTLLRHVLEEGSWENPTLRLGRSVRVGEYRQLHDVLDPGASLLDWTQGETGLPRGAAADLLHRFLFTRPDLDRSIGTLSGGEKSRLQLARLAHAKVNLLLLDEPTNHLDLEACEVLEEMLQAYDGTLLVVSHDRYFLDKLVDRVVEVRDRALVSHPGSFETWWAGRQEAGRTRRGALEERGAPDGEGKAEARRAFETRRDARRLVSRLRSRLRELETEIEALEADETQVRRRLERAFGADGDRREGERLARRHHELRARLADRYGRWERAAEDLAEAEAEAGTDPGDGAPIA